MKMKETQEDMEVKKKVAGLESSMVVADELRQFIERIEQLEAEKKDLMGQIKEVFAESKGRGFDNKAIRVVLKERKASAADLAELAAIVDLYKSSLGLL